MHYYFSISMLLSHHMTFVVKKTLVKIGFCWHFFDSTYIFRANCQLYQKARSHKNKIHMLPILATNSFYSKPFTIANRYRYSDKKNDSTGFGMRVHLVEKLRFVRVQRSTFHTLDLDSTHFWLKMIWSSGFFKSTFFFNQITYIPPTITSFVLSIFVVAIVDKRNNWSITRWMSLIETPN